MSTTTSISLLSSVAMHLGGDFFQGHLLIQRMSSDLGEPGQAHFLQDQGVTLDEKEISPTVPIQSTAGGGRVRLPLTTFTASIAICSFITAHSKEPTAPSIAS
ncbi:MAG: hypothetical protein H8D78_15845 [Chloroflexi bacterium]|nr:hypothetical protein [Chloroflexota bacterium]